MNTNDPKRRASAITWNEADTCRKFVFRKLQAAGWDDDPHSIAEQRKFTDGRIVVRGNQTQRQKPKRADYLLRYTRDFLLAVVEATPEYKKAADGLQKAKNYAEILDLKFAYAIEFNYLTGIERTVENFPTPADLWSRLRGAEKLTDDSVAQRLLTPANLTTGKEPRYYQRIAIDRTVQSILPGKKRVLPTSGPDGQTGTVRKPRILYLADRNFLVDDPKDKTFSIFGDARHKIEGGIATHGRELYFSTYQSIAKDSNRPASTNNSRPISSISSTSADGKQLRVVKLAAQAGQPDADPFDLLCHLVFNAPVLTRRQRADRVKRQQAAFFHYYQPEAQEILRDLTGNHGSRQRTTLLGASNSWQRWERQYASDGELQFTLPDVLKLPPISHHGNVNEIIGKFGGADRLRDAVNQLQSLPYET